MLKEEYRTHAPVRFRDIVHDILDYLSGTSLAYSVAEVYVPRICAHLTGLWRRNAHRRPFNGIFKSISASISMLAVCTLPDITWDIKSLMSSYAFVEAYGLSSGNAVAIHDERDNSFFR